jgi:uncharacterized protein (DUF1330 family)
MTAYFIAHSNVLDPILLNEYVEKSGPIVSRCGGQLITVGEVTEVMVGSFNYQRCAVFKFPDTESMDRWFHDPEYQALANLRGRAADMVFLKVSEYPGLFEN